MPWLRVGDAAATNPIVAEVWEHPAADERSKMEVFGFVTLCSSISAQHLTDYVISRATAIDVAGSAAAAERLLEIATFAGYLEPITVDTERGPRNRWKLVEDPEFLHMRTREQVEFERARNRDNARPDLVIPVRLRDGDACRYCGQVVNFRARRGRVRGTYDHRHAGRAAETPDDLVVSCQACNSGRGNNEDADLDYPLLPVPERPYYAPETVEWLERSEYVAANGITIPERPARAYRAGHQVRESARPGTPETSGAPTRESARPGTPETSGAPTSPRESQGGGSTETSRNQQKPAGKHSRERKRPGRDGTGRDGSERTGTGRHGGPPQGERRESQGPGNSGVSSRRGKRRRGSRNRGKGRD